MRLSELIDDPGITLAHDPDIRGLTADSREVADGFLFAALPGSQLDGAKFVPAALASGAVAILASADAGVDASGTVLLSSANPRRRFAELAARFFSAQPETIVAVTGTNGKTSVASFTQQIWQQLGHRAASLGTLGVVAPDEHRPLAHTTPEPVTLHRILADLADQGVDHLAMEASSHGLSQCRVDGVRLRAAAFTNLSRDHLDYHKDWEDYLAAKLRLFDPVMPADGVAVLNADADECVTIADVCRRRGQRILTYGANGADLKLVGRQAHPDGQTLTIATAAGQYQVALPLVGDFQAWNVLCALGLVLACGADMGSAVQALRGLTGVPGRVQLVSSLVNGAAVYVDYAHTPDALGNVLRALRPHTAGRLIVVFGCGGDRDAGKRPQMGRAAAQLADLVIVTDDNPRTEDAATIRAETLVGCPDATEIGDRADAIRAGVETLRGGDVLVVAGKGHEQGQIIGDTVRPFDDADEVQAAAAAIEGRG